MTPPLLEETRAGQDFVGFYPEWNLGSPGGWGYQNIGQRIGAVLWKELLRAKPELEELSADLEERAFFPFDSFVAALIRAHKSIAGELFTVVAEEDTLDCVVENKNLATALNHAGVPAVLVAPQEIELSPEGKVSCRGVAVSRIFMDFNNDILAAEVEKRSGKKLTKLLKAPEKEPLLLAVQKGRVINPRSLGPVNIKTIFEFFSTEESAGKIEEGTRRRSLWTRRFEEGTARGPEGEEIENLVSWTRENWDSVRLVLKPEDGHSGIGVFLAGKHSAEEALEKSLAAVAEGTHYIVQKKCSILSFKKSRNSQKRRQKRYFI